MKKDKKLPNWGIVFLNLKIVLCQTFVIVIFNDI
jgi:hypothetical protein